MECELDLHLTGKVVLVVASSKGLGKAIAAQLAMEGTDVMLTSRDAEQLEIAREQVLRDARGRVETSGSSPIWLPGNAGSRDDGSDPLCRFRHADEASDQGPAETNGLRR